MKKRLRWWRLCCPAGGIDRRRSRWIWAARWSMLAQSICATGQPPFRAPRGMDLACRALTEASRTIPQARRPVRAGRIPAGLCPKAPAWEIMTAAPVPSADAV